MFKVNNKDLRTTPLGLRAKKKINVSIDFILVFLLWITLASFFPHVIFTNLKHIFIKWIHSFTFFTNKWLTLNINFLVVVFVIWNWRTLSAGCLPNKGNQGKIREFGFPEKCRKSQGNLLKYLDNQGEISGKDLICF